MGGQTFLLLAGVDLWSLTYFVFSQLRVYIQSFKINGKPDAWSANTFTAKEVYICIDLPIGI